MHKKKAARARAKRTRTIRQLKFQISISLIKYSEMENLSNLKNRNTELEKPTKKAHRIGEKWAKIFKQRKRLEICNTSTDVEKKFLTSKSL